MYSPLRLTIKFLKYLVAAQNAKGHGIHSPFVFDFVTLVLNDKGEYYCYDAVETLRARLLENDATINVIDLGAGSRKGAQNERKISDIARNALKPPKYSRLLFRMANYFKSHTILELGTSLGITTCYLAHADHAAEVVTMEGVPSIAQLASNQFEQMGLKNIKLVEGNFDETLSQALNDLPGIDFAYIDGNHREEPTIRYFNTMYPSLHKDSVVVFDDIHWSKEMENAWDKIKADERVTLTIDLFFIGIVFFKPDFKEKQQFTIRF
jgi:predicted O-methyltransferase YrrM